MNQKSLHFFVTLKSNNITIMTFDNSRTIISIRIRLFTITVLLIAYLIVVYFAHIIKFPILGMNETVITTILICGYLLFAIYPIILDYQFISYSDDDDKLVFRYFTSGIAGGRKNSVEIKKSDFAGYLVEKKFMGIKTSISLFHQMPQGVAKYPPIYITVLSRKERARLLNSLYSHTPKDAEEVKK
jgi:hypothetical protein